MTIIALCCFFGILGWLVVGSIVMEMEESRLASFEANEREIQKWCEENGEEYT